MSNGTPVPERFAESTRAQAPVSHGGHRADATAVTLGLSAGSEMCDEGRWRVSLPEDLDAIGRRGDGLWPQYSYGGWPSCCRPTTFDDNKISRLKTILEEYWPSLYCGSFSTCFGGKRPFWVHEWETHGTCGYPEIQDEYDYFSTALYLYSKYNVTKALRKAHIYPRGGRKYLVSHIVSAIEFSFGAMPSIVCKNGSVQELRLCFHKDYQLRDCVVEGENSVNRRSHCPRYVTLPSYKPHAISDSTEGISNQVNVEHQSFE
uniref:Uncharacterized protein n=1 Tax=Oryza brachyantha TaxID=4533 RepID=J3L6Q5_ORYBR